MKRPGDMSFDRTATASGTACRWDAPGGRPSVIFDRDVLQELRSRVIEAFLSLPKRGVEVGGFLLGRIETAEPLTIRIDGFEPVLCEHRHGPSYVLSDTDRAQLEDALARRKSGSNPRVIGFYRSYT